MRAALPGRFAAHLAESRLLEGPGLALLAVSGGPDSMALLDLMAGVAAARGLELLVVHADHGIHPESARVAADVAGVARGRYQLDCVTRELRLGADASETLARESRYEFFREVQRERSARYLVTAHHRDDQVETVLLRLLRGSGPTGLAGIPAVAPGGLVRPLLPFARAELAGHARAAGLPVFDDPANRDSRHTRSWVRTELLPMIESRLGAQATESLLAVQQHAARDLLAWDLALDALGTLDVRAGDGRADLERTALATYDPNLAARLVRAAARRAGLVVLPLQAARVAEFAAEAASGRRLDLGGGLEAEAAFERLVIRRVESGTPPVTLAGERGEVRFGAVSLSWRREAAPEHLEREGWTTWIGGDAGLLVRRAARGDRMIPLGGTGHRAVSRLMMEARIARTDRERHPIVISGNEPLWIPGVCRGETAIPKPGTMALRLDAQTG